MQIVFVSNYINHHQIPVSEELFRLTGGDYAFIQTEPMEEERISMGWDSTSADKPYVRLFYEDSDVCQKLIFDADCVIFGGTEKEELIKERLEAGKFTIRYSERLYKEGRWKFVSPRGLIKKYHDHTKFRKADVYLLCSGAYVAGDFRLVCSYPGKMMKYGYFPKFEEYPDVHGKRRNNDVCEILWAARFIDWKHPEVMAELAGLIKKDCLPAKITLIGTGELEKEIKAQSAGLEDVIFFAGSKTPDEVREYMRKADIFVSTSDRKEGWGAVVNEAMNSGCVVMAAKEIGAAPYLIESGVNGFMYKATKTGELYSHIKECVSDKEKRYRIGQKAYETIRDEWNPIVAANRLFEFINDKNRTIGKYSKGPLSKA